MTIDYQPTDALIKAAENGPHKGWATFGIEGEGTCFQDLHDLLSNSDFVFQDADEIVRQITSIVQSYGYATRDSHLHQLGDINPDDLESLFDAAETEDEQTRYAILLSNRQDDDGDFIEGDYFAEINRSLKALGGISAAASKFVANAKIFDRLNEAYITGMKTKDEESFSRSTMKL